MSDFAEQYSPNQTRSGTIYNNRGLSIYTKIGCEPINDWDEPERKCDVKTINNNLFQLINNEY